MAIEVFEKILWWGDCFCLRKSFDFNDTVRFIGHYIAVVSVHEIIEGVIRLLGSLGVKLSWLTMIASLKSTGYKSRKTEAGKTEAG